jgi:hypothetical protein
MREKIGVDLSGIFVGWKKRYGLGPCASDTDYAGLKTIAFQAISNK